MSIITARILECNSCLRMMVISDRESVREARSKAKKKGWSRVRRGQSMADICNGCRERKELV